MGLRQAKRAEHLALRQRCKPLLLLLGIAVAQEYRVNRAIGHADGCAGTTVTGCNFFEHQRQRHVVQIGATEFLRHTYSVSAQSRQPLVRLFREMMLLVPAGGIRP